MVLIDCGSEPTDLAGPDPQKVTGAVPWLHTEAPGSGKSVGSKPIVS